MASELSISPSYLNHLERNQRPITAAVLLKLAQAYDIDLKGFTADSEVTSLEELAEIFTDPLFADIGIPRDELLELAHNAPSVADAISRLYAALAQRRQAPEGGDAVNDAPLNPAHRVLDYIHLTSNYFP